MMKFFVKRQRIEITEREVIASGQIAFVTLKFTFDCSWEESAQGRAVFPVRCGLQPCTWCGWAVLSSAVGIASGYGENEYFRV